MKLNVFLKAMLFVVLVNYSAAAQEVLKEGMFESGEQNFVWDSGDVPQGAYLLHLTADGQTAKENIIIPK